MWRGGEGGSGKSPPHRACCSPSSSPPSGLFIVQPGCMHVRLLLEPHTHTYTRMFYKLGFGDGLVRLMAFDVYF